MSQFYLFPRSLRKLVLLAFLSVILPLFFLVVQAYRSLDNLSAEAAVINKLTLKDALRIENINNMASLMERSYLHSCLLQDPSIKKLYYEHYERYSVMLKEHANFIHDDSLYQKLDLLLDGISELKCENDEPEEDVILLLEQFIEENNRLFQKTQESIFSRGTKLQESIAQQGTFFGQLALMVFVLCLILVVLFTQMIIGPVKVINRMITLLGQGTFIGENPSVSGPLELKELVQRIVWLSDRLAWLENQRHQFLRHISHELKTPLASMREGTALLADQVVGALTKDQMDVVGILDESSRHLQRLIEQLLDYNKKQLDSADKDKEINLETLVSEIMNNYGLLAKSKLMETTCALSVNNYYGSEKLLARVIDNLYSNAVHYGKESGNIWISSQIVANYLQIDIANTGHKIPEKDRPMLFEAFFQGSHQRKGAVKGSGLGLNIARDCVSRMKGELQLVDVDYADVCFRIKLPLKTES